MFQTQINHWLQSFSSSFLDQFMILITSMGYEKFFFLIVTIVLFGIDFKKGFYLVHILIINSVLINIFKNLFALPRPSEVDNSLKIIGQIGNNNSPFNSTGASSFWGFLPSEVVNFYRHIKGYSYGIPSGHVCSTTVMWGSIYFLFRKKILLISGIIITFLMAISRMYLAKHFLADVIGGFVLGFLILAAGFFLMIGNGNVERISVHKKDFQLKNLKNLLVIIYLLALPLILLLIPSENIKISASLLGFNLGYLFLIQQGLPADNEIIFKRIIRVLLALVIFIMMQALFNAFSKDVIGNNNFTEYVMNFISVFVMVAGTVKIGSKFKLYNIDLKK